MEHEAKNKSPYKGVGVVCILLVLVPLAVYFIIYGAINNFQANKYLDAHNILTSKIFATLIGFLFHISCFVAGVFKDARAAVVERRKEFRENLFLSLGFAISSYFYDMRKNGIVYLIYSVIILANVILLLHSLYTYMNLYL